jgi:glycosyltransferase involved in cell wall biosynthesis
MWRTLRATGAMVRVMRLIDVEHRNALQFDGADRGAIRRRRRRSRMVLCAERRAATAATDVLFVSREDQRDFEREGITGCFLPVTVRVADEPAPCSTGNRLAFVGSLNWWPNRQGLTWFLEEVMPRVLAERPDVELRLFGGGDADGLADRFEQANARRMGFVPDLTAALRECDLAVVPVVGGTGVKTKTLELLAAGLPVATTNDGVRGTPAADGGALVADSSEAFAAAVLSLLADPDLRAQLSAKGLDTVRREHDASHTLRWVDTIRARVETGAR